MDLFQLQQHIQTSTRITPTTSSLIDVIITQIRIVKHWKLGIVLYTCVVRLAFLRSPLASVFEQVLSFYLSSHVTSDDPNIFWNDFNTNFLTIAQKHVPLWQPKVKYEHKPWLTNEIKQLIFLQRS